MASPVDHDMLRILFNFLRESQTLLETDKLSLQIAVGDVTIAKLNERIRKRNDADESLKQVIRYMTSEADTDARGVISGFVVGGRRSTDVKTNMSQRLVMLFAEDQRDRILLRGEVLEKSLALRQRYRDYITHLLRWTTLYEELGDAETRYQDNW